MQSSFFQFNRLDANCDLMASAFVFSCVVPQIDLVHYDYFELDNVPSVHAQTLAFWETVSRAHDHTTHFFCQRQPIAQQIPAELRDRSH